MFRCLKALLPVASRSCSSCGHTPYHSKLQYGFQRSITSFSAPSPTESGVVECPYRTGLSVIPTPEGNFGQLLTERWLQYGDRKAFTETWSGRTISFSQLYDRVKSVASALKREGLARSDVVAIVAPNSIDYYIFYVAVITAGGVTTTLNPAFKKGELTYCLQQSQPRFVAADSELMPVIKEVLMDMNEFINVQKIFSLNGHCEGCMPVSLMDSKEDWLSDDPTADVHPDDMCSLLYSSGTTGLPKGVMLTHRNIMTQITQYSVPEVSPLRPGVTVSCVLPFFHIYGQVTVTSNSLFNGSDVVLSKKYQPEDFLEGIQKHKINFLYIVPPMLLLGKSDLPARYDLGPAKYAIVGAAPCPEEELLRFQEAFQLTNFRQAYGLTETTSVTHTNILDKIKLNSIGPCVQGLKSKVLDVETGEALPAYGQGEVLVKGGNIMKGYYRNESATKECLTEDGWLHTGDIGYYDEDGYFYIIDRLKELIKYKGNQVAPAELEALLLTHPSVKDAAVIGIPSEEAGEVPRAYVVCKSDTRILEDDIIEFVRENAASYKSLRGGVKFVSEIPKSPSGKILRKTLREELKQELRTN